MARSMASLFNHLLICLCTSNLLFIISYLAESLAAVHFQVDGTRTFRDGNLDFWYLGTIW
jgi:hypothetical protein